MFTLIDEDLIQPFDDYLTSDEDKKWVEGFYPAFMENSQTGGKTYGIPFQRSTPVLYWNKEAFEAAGLDPEVAPATWDEMVEFGKKLTKKDDSGNVTQWGVRIPSSGFPYLLFQGLAIENGAILANADGNKTNFDDPKVVEALQYLVDLSTKHEVMAPGIIEWGATPKAFFEGQTAMMWTSTGNLTNVRDNAPFKFGVAMLPERHSRGAPTGGGNFYLFKGASDEQNKAAVKFVQWITAPEQSAKWTIATGYVAPRAETWETDTMKAYAADFPAVLVARDQLDFAKAELATYQNQRVTGIFNDAACCCHHGPEGCRNGSEGSSGAGRRDPERIPLTPIGAERRVPLRCSVPFPRPFTVLTAICFRSRFSPYRGLDHEAGHCLERDWIHGWLLLLPAMVFLFAFTHIPRGHDVPEQLFFHPARTPPGQVHRPIQL